MLGTTESLLRAITYGAVCSGSLALGGAAAAYRPPTAVSRSYVQHIAAGFVFAAVSVEVLPDVMDRHQPLMAAIGFAAGVALMLLIRSVAERAGEDVGAGRMNWTFLAVLVTDIFVDGALIGVSAATDREEGKQALLVTVALAVELLSLGLSMAATLMVGGISRSRTIAVAAALSLTPLIGVVAGHFLGASLSGASIEVVLAFAAAAFLYLAAEELLKEAHEVPESLLSTTLFFAAFLAVLLIDMATPAGF